MYFITPIAGGTQLKNSSGTIELQVQKSSVSGLSDVTSGTDARIYDGATLLAAQTGVTDGGNGVAYNPIIAPSFITGTKTLTLKDNSGNVLDTITLVDVTDGLGGGSFISPNLKSTRNPADNSFTPTLLHATASFFDTSGTEYQGRARRRLMCLPSMGSSGAHAGMGRHSANVSMPRVIQDRAPSQ